MDTVQDVGRQTVGSVRVQMRPSVIGMSSNTDFFFGRKSVISYNAYKCSFTFWMKIIHPLTVAHCNAADNIKRMDAPRQPPFQEQLIQRSSFL